MKLTKYIASSVLILASAVISIYLRLANPDMTEIRLFINFWWAWAFVAICAVSGLTILGAFKIRK